VGFRLHPDAKAGTSMPFTRMGATAFCLMALGYGQWCRMDAWKIPNSSRFDLDSGFLMDAFAGMTNLGMTNLIEND